MKVEEINIILDKMLVEQKSRSFLNHLVRAYIPISKVNMVLEAAENPFNCVLTKAPLTSFKTILDSLQTDEVKNSFKAESKTFITEEGINVSRSLANIIGEAQLAVTGMATNTVMSYDAFQTFYTWVFAKSLEGDKHINWLLGSIRREKFAKAAKINKPILEKKIKRSIPNQTSYTLGQTTGVLANLKSKLLNEEKGNG